MNCSGYDKVYQLLLGHPDLQDMLRIVRSDATSARTVDFSVQSYDSDRTSREAKITSTAEYLVVTGSGRRLAQKWRTGIRIEEYVTTSLCRRVVEEWFGSRVKTYGCDRSVCIVGLRKHKGLGKQRSEYAKHDSFHAWIVRHAETIVPEIAECRTRLDSEQAAIEKSDAYREKVRDSQAACAAKAIKEAIFRFRHLGDDVIQDGFRLASVEHLMEL